MALSIGPTSRRHVPRIEVYTRDGCGLCREAERLVAEEAGRARISHIDIDEDPQLQERYDVRVPVVVVDGREISEGRLAPGEVARAIKQARRGRWAQWRQV